VTIDVRVIGIGTGNLEHLTQEAVRALNEVDLFLVADKGPAKADLAALRTEICRHFITSDRYRVVEVPDPDRGSDRDRDAGAYRTGVESWHAARAERYADVVRSQLGEHGTVGFLVWGDPAFYDSTIRVAERMRESGLALTLRVIPGISSLQLLAARHAIVLNRIGQSVHLTTGRRLVEEYQPGLGDVAVMLDADLACGQLAAEHPGLWVYWGAQLGLVDEALVSGPLAEVLDEVRRTRQAIRQRRGWVLDTYLLRWEVPA
jgi:precorrin-6A synthase